MTTTTTIDWERPDHDRIGDKLAITCMDGSRIILDYFTASLLTDDLVRRYTLEPDGETDEAAAAATIDETEHIRDREHLISLLATMLARYYTAREKELPIPVRGSISLFDWTAIAEHLVAHFADVRRIDDLFDAIAKAEAKTLESLPFRVIKAMIEP